MPPAFFPGIIIFTPDIVWNPYIIAIGIELKAMPGSGEQAVRYFLTIDNRNLSVCCIKENKRSAISAGNLFCFQQINMIYVLYY
jgi:hypothetical protein